MHGASWPAARAIGKDDMAGTALGRASSGDRFGGIISRPNRIKKTRRTGPMNPAVADLCGLLS
jgi:hypothetical protein